MSTPTAETIAARAYQLWEKQGRPVDDGRSLERWLAAERELRRDAEANPTPARTPASFQPESAPLSSTGPAITNLDRSVSPAERTRLRNERHGRVQVAVSPTTPPEHFVIAADRAHVRFHRETKSEVPGTSPRWELVSAIDLPAGRQGYTDRDTDQAGRFPGSKGASPGGSIDERLPMLEEHQRRTAATIAMHIEQFLENYREATWDFAAGSEIHRAILDALSAPTRQRLQRALAKDLVHQPSELRRQFQMGAATRV